DPLDALDRFVAADEAFGAVVAVHVRAERAQHADDALVAEAGRVAVDGDAPVRPLLRALREDVHRLVERPVPVARSVGQLGAHLRGHVGVDVVLEAAGVADDRITPLLALGRVVGDVAREELLLVVLRPLRVLLDEGGERLDDALVAQLGPVDGDVVANGVADLAGRGQLQLLRVEVVAREPLALDLDAWVLFLELLEERTVEGVVRILRPVVDAQRDHLATGLRRRGRRGGRGAGRRGGRRGRGRLGGRRRRGGGRGWGGGRGGGRRRGGSRGGLGGLSGLGRGGGIGRRRGRGARRDDRAASQDERPTEERSSADA